MILVLYSFLRGANDSCSVIEQVLVLQHRVVAACVPRVLLKILILPPNKPV